MTDLLAGMGIAILSIALLIGGIIVIVFLILNEEKLKETKSTQELKKMYKDAIYVSLGIIVIGIIGLIPAIYLNGDAWFGGIILWAGLFAIAYSSIGFYNISHGKQQK